MKMKDQLESAQPMKKHKAKSKKNELKKKKQEKLEAKKHSKEKKPTSRKQQKPTRALLRRLSTKKVVSSKLRVLMRKQATLTVNVLPKASRQ
ncbi:hypothetical protein N5P32_06735 [Marinomonas pontica]|uniref:hypothetical protein n=1 Tax=Marinomonas pontica TaxID=264739 RepID=UPI002242EBDA|nr:hypothetical protein [Marinomonas pontica]MCW8355599.1 hypothetical protein [Marinomonas pontica]